VNTNNYVNRIFSVFDTLNNEFSPGSYLVDTFSSYFSFYYTNHRNKESKNSHIHKLDKCVFNALSDSKSVVVVSDTSIKNNTTISIAYIHLLSNSIKKAIHHIVNITSIEAKLFAIKYGIN